MTKRMREIGVFDNPTATENALQKLNDSHFLLDRVFIVARDMGKETEIVGSELCESLRDRYDERISSIAKQDIGIKAGGIVISLTKALVQLDVPVDMASFYNDMVAQSKYLVIIEGDLQNIAGAKKILMECDVQNLIVYEIIVEHPEIIIIDRHDAA